MKRINFIMFFIAAFGILLISSCSDDFLDQGAIGAYTDEVLSTENGVNKTLIGAYSLLNGSGGLVRGPGQMLFGSIRGGEANKGSSTGDQPQMIDIQKFEVTAANTSNRNFFQFFYNAIFRCNSTLKILSNVKSGLTAEKVIQITAEARFLRGHNYFMLKRLYNNIPWIDETTTDVRGSNTDESGNYIDIWSKIQADFDYARKNLPEAQKDLGRPNKWAAESYYAKVRIYMGNAGDPSGYTEALLVLNDIMINGKTNKMTPYRLYDNYHDNFNPDTENGSEWVWGVQHSVNDGTTGVNPANGSQDMQYIGTQSGSGPGLGRGYGFFCPTQWFVDHFRVDENGLPYLDGYNSNSQSVKNDEGLSSANIFVPETAPLDPRLDWSVGRRGIPFLDYGIMPGISWLRDAAASGPFLSKKFFTLKQDDGKHTVSGGSYNSLNIAFIRYADVLLMAAEVEARIGSNERARELVNLVRNRMATNTNSPQNWIKNNDGTNAANYMIKLYPLGSPAFATRESALKAILYERLLELGLEGHRAYDVIRFGQADDGKTDQEEFNSFIAFESKRRGYLSSAVYTKVPDMFMPIPQEAVDNSFKDGSITLKQNPGY